MAVGAMPAPVTDAGGSAHRLGALLAGLALGGLALPFLQLRPNRIAAATPHHLWESLPPLPGALCVAGIVLVAAGIVLLRRPEDRLAVAAIALAGLALALGRGATALVPADLPYARVAPGAGFWLLLLAFALAAADALARLGLRPAGRVLVLAAVAAGVGAGLRAGLWEDLSVLREHAGRSEAFARALATHLGLSLGATAAALGLGVPAALAISRRPRLRAAVLAGINLVQTIPSMALFGLMIAPLAWIAATVPGAAAAGIAGIGLAPAAIALVAYALMPVTAATLAGLDAVPAAVLEAADGMGMTPRQRLLRVALPLALPGILTGARIVLVQTIGLAVIAGLVGGGGLGVFVFQGISQTAPDLVLLGALPTVAMAVTAGILLDAAVEASR